MIRTTVLWIIVFGFTTVPFLVITFVNLVQYENTSSADLDRDKMTTAGKESLKINKKKPHRRTNRFTEIRSDYSETRSDHRREVINGRPTESISDYPYTVSLLNRDSRDQTWHTCGGTLIARNIVLSAAHCRDHVKVAQVGKHTADHVQRRLRLKDHFFKDQRMSTPRGGWKDTRYQRRKTLALLDDTAFTVHEGYNPQTGENDFMLIRLPQSFDDTPFPKLNNNANVPNAYASYKERKVVVSGWGITRNGDFSSGSVILLKATLIYVNNYKCGIAYGVQHIKSNMLCAHSRSGRDACQGDSGGPLFMQDDDPADDLLVGVVSWGASCGSSKYPGVYARVSSAYRWINRITCDRLSPESCDENGRIRPFVSTDTSPAPSRQPSRAATLSPTQPPQSNDWFQSEGDECLDYPGDFYIKSSDSKSRNCDWLDTAKSAALIWYRCYHFAYYCPKTCGICP